MELSTFFRLEIFSLMDLRTWGPDPCRNSGYLSAWPWPLPSYAYASLVPVGAEVENNLKDTVLDK